MGWLVALVLFPLLLALVMLYVVAKLAELMLRAAFAPLALLRRR